MNRAIYLIGSRALEWHSVGFTTGRSSDWDLVCEPEDRELCKSFEGFNSRTEIHDINDLNNREICEKYSNAMHFVKWFGLFDTTIYVVSLEGLAAIKRSHLYRDHFWDKHIAMYQKYLKPHMTDESYKIAMERKKLTIAKFKSMNPKLNQSNEDFFDDAVDKKYDHDSIHEIVAYYDKPLYTRLKKDDKVNLAWCEKDLWNNFSYEDKLKCVAEETFVIAAERFLIPSDWKHSFKFAYFKALKKVCTTLTSGWFRDFAIDNFDEIKNLYDENVLLNLKVAINNL